MGRCSIHVAFALALTAAPALADTRAECVGAYDSAQRLRKAGDLVGARQKLERCARGDCPDIARSDCVVWLREVEQALPSVVFRVRDAAGADVSDARVFVDDAMVQDRIDGRAVPVNPGERRVRVERGERRIERTLVASQGEKNRMIVIALPGAGAPARQELAPEPVADTEPGAGPPTAAWILAGVSVVALGSFGYFAITGTNEVETLRDDCGPTCDQSDLDAARTKLLVADISLAIALVSGGAAAWLFLSAGEQRSDEAALRAGVVPAPGGASIAVDLSF